MADDLKDKNKAEEIDADELDKLLEKRVQLDSLLEGKFSKVITVMFTDLKGYTSLADREGDISSRILVKHYNDIIFPLIKKNNGILVKTIGDGTLSYFENAQDALRTAVQIQKGIDEYIVAKKPKIPILAHIGMHTGKCIMEKNDIFGDTVNTAARFESIAEPSSVFLSEDTYNSLTDKSEIYCRFVKTATLKVNIEPVKVYKAFWNPDEAQFEDNKAATLQEAVAGKGFTSAVKLILILLIPILIIFLLIQGGRIITWLSSGTEKRSIRHSTDTKVFSDDKK